MSRKIDPTTEQYTNLQAAYTYFNNALFGGKLKPCMLTFGRDVKKCFGYFHADQWTTGEKDKKTGDAVTCHTISLTPMYLDRDLRDVFGTLVHEMCHLWKADEDKANNVKKRSRGYHCSVWAAKMEEVGLIPSDTGRPGGKKVGMKVSHYIDASGPYAQAFDKLPKAISLAWQGIATPKKERAVKDKIKYVCPDCGAKVWGKPELNVMCGDCNVPLLEPV